MILRKHLAGLLFLTLCCACIPKSQQIAAEEQTVEIFSDSVYIHHQSYGEGAYTVLFVHGWCIDQTYWSNQVQALSSSYRVVTVDLPGFGQSGDNREDWSIEAYGRDIVAVIDQLQLKNVVLVGHSMGGDVVLEAARQSSAVVALVGVDNFKDVVYEESTAVQEEIAAFMELLEDDFVNIVAVYANAVLFHHSTDSLVRSRVHQSFAQANQANAIASIGGLISYATKEPLQLEKLAQPLYLINSNATPTDTTVLNRTGVDYQLVPIDNTGHYPMIEKPEVFNGLLKKVLRRIFKT